MRKFFVPRPAKPRAVTIDQDGMVRLSPTAQITPQEKFAAYIRGMQSLAGSPGEVHSPSSPPPGGPADTGGGR